MTALTYTALARRAVLVARAWTTWHRASLVFAVYAGTFIGSLCGVVYMAHEAGRAEAAQLALDAFAREEHYQQLLDGLYWRSVETLSVALREDIYLHAEMRARVPDWHRFTMIVQENLLDIDP